MLSRGRARGEGAAVRATASRRRGRGARRAGQSQLPAAAAAGTTPAARSTSATPRSSTPATFFAFDLLGFEDFDLRPLPLTDRKALLQAAAAAGSGVLRYLEHFEQDGEVLSSRSSGSGLEGVVAKKADCAVSGGPSAVVAQDPHAARPATSWWSASPRPRARRSGFGALHLATTWTAR